MFLMGEISRTKPTCMGRISSLTPLGAALIGLWVEQTIEFQTAGYETGKSDRSPRFPAGRGDPIERATIGLNMLF